MLRGRLLLVLETLLLLDALLSLLRALLTGLLKLGLKIGLLLIVRLLVRGRLRRAGTTLRLIQRVLLQLLLIRLLVRGRLRRADATLRLIQRVLLQLLLIRLLVGRALRCLGCALRLIQLMLALLVFERLGVVCLVRRALRGVGLVLRPLDGGLLVTLLCVRVALFLVQRKLFLTDIGLHRAHLVTRLVETVVHKKLAITVMFGDCIVVVVLFAAAIQDILT